MSEATVWSKTKELIAENGKLVTAFCVVFIILTGFVLLAEPSKWYLPAGGVVLLFAAIFAFAHAKVVVKTLAACLLLLGVSSISYQIGLLFDPYSSGPLLWFFSYFLVFFVSLAYSYLYTRGKSRWGSLSLALVAAFLGAYITAYVAMNTYYAALVAMGVGIIVYLLFYSFTKASRYKSRNMPMNIVTPEITATLFEDADNQNWFMRDFVRDDKGHYLAWNEERAYLLVPVYMDEPFTMTGTKRKSGLGYKGETINPWLVDLIYNKMPFWKSKHADMTVVLLDLKRANGKQPRSIGVSLPDTKKLAVVGVFPANRLLTGELPEEGLLNEINHEFYEFGQTLSSKQLNALERIGIYDKHSLSSAQYNDA